MHTMLQVHTRKLKLDPDVTDDVLRQVARDLPGLSGQRRRPARQFAASTSMPMNSDCMLMRLQLHLGSSISSLVRMLLACCYRTGGMGLMEHHGDVR